MGFDLNQALKDLFGYSDGKPVEGKVADRHKYQEALVTELLRTLVAIETLTKDEAVGVIRRAKESAK